ncbi:MAG TPA: aconitate hydratase AcnA, partial [Terriglobales bacterium]|nr:aconitate hydratase AcnA [Terriglobales bacterium]
AEYSELLSLDLGTVEPSLAGPKRPQDRVPLSKAKESFEQALPSLIKTGKSASSAVQAVSGNGHPRHGSVVIAAITSCTNTSNPSVMLAAGLLAKKAVERGLEVPAWVKTSLAPGSKVVRDYLVQAGLTGYLEKLKFHIVGYGCTTCIGNSGPLPEEVSSAIEAKNLVVASVLSGNRNFEGRINPEVRANYLMSPPLVVAFALAGRIDLDLRKDALGTDKQGNPVYLADIWPARSEVEEAMRHSISSPMFRQAYDHIYEGDTHWRSLQVPAGETYTWDPNSTYIRRPPYFDGMEVNPAAVEDIENARVLAMLGDSVTTDHISPAGSIKPDSPAGKYLIEHGVRPAEFNSYGSRRGNHEVMVRGTFANVRLRNKLVPQREGGFTRHLPDGCEMTIFEAAERYRGEGVPLVLLAGKEYGAGSSRDWAAKGPRLLGVRAVIAESYERIHRSNLVGMGILPLEFLAGESAATHGLTGEEEFTIRGVGAVVESFVPRPQVKVAASFDGKRKEFLAWVRIDTPQEAQYYRNGGILQFVLRQLLAGNPEPEAVTA